MPTKWEIVKEKATAALLDAAALEISEKGYGAATTRSIAARAGVSSGLISKYFGVKERLLQALTSELYLDKIFKDVDAEDPYMIFCIYMDYARRLQQERPVRFKFHLRIINDPATPALIEDTSRKLFAGSLMEKAILAAQAAGELISGDPFEIYKVFFSALYGLLAKYSDLGVKAPDNDAILNIIGYNRKEKEYRLQREMMSEMEISYGIISALTEDFDGVNYIKLTDNNLNDITVGYRTSELMKRIIPGWDAEKNFSRRLDMLKNRVVYEPDRPQFYADTRWNIVESNLQNASSYSVYTRFFIDSEIRYYEIKFSPVRANGILTGIVAGLHSIDEQRRKELEEQHQLENALAVVKKANKRIRESETYRGLIDSIASSYNVAMTVNMIDDSFRLIRMDSAFIEKLQWDSFRSFTAIKASLSTILHPTEKRHVLRELEYDSIRGNLKGMQSYNVEYQVLLDNVTSWHELKITKINEKEIAIGFAEKDLEITKRRLEEKRYDGYFALLLADLDTERLKVIKNENCQLVAPVGTSEPYAIAMQRIASAIPEETKPFFIQLSDLNYVRKELAIDDKRTFTYKSDHLKKNQWVELTSYVILRNDDGTPAMVSFGFSLIDTPDTTREEWHNQ